MSEESIKTLRVFRSGKRQSATKSIKYISDNLGSFSIELCKSYLDKLKTLKDELISLDYRINSRLIIEHSLSDEQYAHELEREEEYLDEIRLIFEMVTSQVNRLTASASEAAGGGVTAHVNSQQKITLPSIELPTFDGKPEAFHKFITSFENLISRYNLSSFEKFTYLIKQLSGPARKILESLNLHESNYESAKKLLTEAFSDKLSQQFSVISDLIMLKLRSDSKDAYTWIGDARLLTEQVRSLNITSDIFTQYFLLNSMNSEMKKIFTEITRKSKPNLEEINDSMFEANTRYVELRRSSPIVPVQKSINIVSEQNTAAVTAVAVNSNSPKCSLCSYDSTENTHKLSECVIYNDCRSRISKLKAINGCDRCGFVNHNSQNCNFKFRKPCYYCSGYHMSFLCNKNESLDSNEKNLPVSNVKKSVKNKSKVNKQNFQNTTSSNSTTTVSMSIGAFNDVILPTATAYLEYPNKSVGIRVFKDTGSQCTFVKGTPDSIANSELISYVDLNVKGINSIEKYKAPIIRFPLMLPGQGKVFVKAICRENLNTEALAPGLNKLASYLKNKGVNLADKNIDQDKLSNISLILGSDNCHILPIVQRDFSIDDQVFSCIFDTPSGVMLVGSVECYNKNLKAFPFPKKTD